MKYHLSSIYLFCVCALHFSISAQDTKSLESFDLEEERVIRENPTIDGADDDIDIIVPSFIDEAANHIILNGNDWTSLNRALDNSTHRPFSIVHIGDSHIQADIATGQTRMYMQYDYGNAGRGLVVPLKMSNTNQPIDYKISSRKPWNAVKLMSQNWKKTMGFTGTSISPATTLSEITFATDDNEDYNPFSSLTVFHKGQFFVTAVTDSRGNLIPFTSTPSQDYTHIDLLNDVTSVTLIFESAGDLTIFGANLMGNRPGVFYHAIGNNGATYDTYNRIGNVGKGISPLNPNLVIISLGANEAFGKFNESLFNKSIDKLVRNIRSANPSAKILLVTPSECQRVKYTSVPVKSKGKRRRRTSKKRVGGYTVNSNILPIRNAILEYGKEHDIAVYDWYEVSGGANSSAKWLADGLLSKDRVHLTYKGYHLQGYLLYQALKKELYN